MASLRTDSVFPTEVWHLILSNVHKRRDFYSLCLVSSYLNALVTPFLYRSVIVWLAECTCKLEQLKGKKYHHALHFKYKICDKVKYASEIQFVRSDRDCDDAEHRPITSAPSSMLEKEMIALSKLLDWNRLRSLVWRGGSPSFFRTLKYISSQARFKEFSVILDEQATAHDDYFDKADDVVWEHALEKITWHSYGVSFELPLLKMLAASSSTLKSLEICTERESGQMAQSTRGLMALVLSYRHTWPSLTSLTIHNSFLMYMLHILMSHDQSGTSKVSLQGLETLELVGSLNVGICLQRLAASVDGLQLPLQRLHASLTANKLTRGSMCDLSPESLAALETLASHAPYLRVVDILIAETESCSWEPLCSDIAKSLSKRAGKLEHVSIVGYRGYRYSDGSMAKSRGTFAGSNQLLKLCNINPIRTLGLSIDDLSLYRLADLLPQLTAMPQLRTLAIYCRPFFLSRSNEASSYWNPNSIFSWPDSTDWYCRSLDNNKEAHRITEVFDVSLAMTTQKVPFDMQKILHWCFGPRGIASLRLAVVAWVVTTPWDDKRHPMHGKGVAFCRNELEPPFEMLTARGEELPDRLPSAFPSFRALRPDDHVLVEQLEDFVALRAHYPDIVAEDFL